jgi:hypothetical protein
VTQSNDDMQLPSPARVKVMYELVSKMQRGAQVAPESLRLQSGQLQLLQSGVDGIKLYTNPNCTQLSTASDDQQLRISSVSIVADLKPDPTLVWLDTVPAAAWATTDAADLESVRMSIEAAGQGLIENPREQWVRVGAAGYAGAQVHGYTATQLCEEQSKDDAAGCSCTVDVPALYSDSTSSTSVFRSSAVSTVTLDVLLRPCAPPEVVKAVKHAVSAPLPLRTAVCVRLVTTHVTVGPEACTGALNPNSSTNETTGA